MVASINSRTYGTLPSGKSVEIWTLAGRGGLVLEAITYGGIVTRLLAPDRNGRFDDVVLGYDDLEGYLAGGFYFGAITGRVAGRIPNASFTLEGQAYNLARNDPPNHLHGGIEGFNKKLWTATPLHRADSAPSLRLAYLSTDGEEGYPGNLEVAVTYTVTGRNVFLIETEAMTDRTTPLSLTHHSYFNLGGHATGSILDHALQVFAEEFVPLDEHIALTGRLALVHGDNDFRSPRLLADAIPRLFARHGDMYALPARGAGQLVRAARVTHAASGRVLTASTTESFLQLYTGSHLEDRITGKASATYGRHAGLCLECEGYPDPSNRALRNSTLVHPGAPLRHATAYAFSIAGSDDAANAPPRDGGENSTRE
ncbi:MAG: aldose epimerase family protein [Terracidiphilus sp.]